SDALTIEDMEAVQHQVDGIVAASPVLPLNDRVAVGGGKERDLQIMGVYREHHAGSVHRDPLFSANAGGEADFLFGLRYGPGGADHGPGSACPSVASSARVRL